jgi:hypothetical protein
MVEWCFLKVVGWSYKDVFSAIFFTFLSGHFACLVWAKLKHLHGKLDAIFGKIEVLQQAIKVDIFSPRARTSGLTSCVSPSNRTLLFAPTLNTSPCPPSLMFFPIFRKKSPH